MVNMNIDSLQKYIHNLKQLQQTMIKLGLNEASAAAGENIQIAEDYLNFMKKTRGKVRCELERKQ